MRVLAVEEVFPNPKSGRVLHADSGCRQRSYEYVVPISWLRGAENYDCGGGTKNNPAIVGRRAGEARSGTAIDAFYGKATDDVREALRNFKVALRGCTRTSLRAASKERGGGGEALSSSWHNFNGDGLSPFHAFLQRSGVDFAKVVNMVLPVPKQKQSQNQSQNQNQNHNQKGQEATIDFDDDGCGGPQLVV